MKLKTLILVWLVTAAVFATSSAWAATLKIAALSPDGTYVMKELRKAGKEIKKRTDGRVKIKYYPGGVMGDDKAVLKKMRIRQLHGGIFTSSSLTRFSKDNQVYNLAFKFKSFDEVDYVRDHMDSLLLDDLNKSKLVALGLFEVGFAYIMSTRPISSVDDLRAQKAWIPDMDKMGVESMKAFSISPIPLPFSDVLAGLQTGVVTTVAGSPIGAIALQWHTKVKYLTDLPLLYSTAALVVDSKAFAKLDSTDQDIVREIFERVSRNIDEKNREDNIAAKSALANQGITFIKPTESETQEWFRLGGLATERVVKEGHVSNKFIEILNQHIDTYRQQTDPESNG